jgi:hypothetical protein
MAGPWLVTSKAAVFKAHLQWLVVGDQDIQPDTDQSALQILLSVPVLSERQNQQQQYDVFRWSQPARLMSNFLPPTSNGSLM